jgi:phosphoribosylanthranilate isomerase
MNVKIKICGVLDHHIMSTISDLNVDYVGLVFFEKSPRNISVKKAKSIIEYLGNSTKTFALTVDATDQFLSSIVTNLSPDYLQLHGEESPYRCFEIKKKFKTKIIKAISAKSSKNLNFQINKYKFISDKIIIDSPKDNLPGGNGKKFNWKFLKKGKKNINWLLAGGINLSNVSKAIKITKTKGLDISSGVEISKGVKSPRLIRSFVKKCRNI